MGRVLLALALAMAVQGAQLPVACKEGVNRTHIAGCVPLLNDTVVPGLSVASGAYRNFHWAVSNYLDLDDSSGNRRSITFEVVPCTGSVELFVRSLRPPFPTSSSYDYAAVLDAETNAITVQMLRAQYFVSVYGSHAPGALAGPATFSIIAKISGKSSYPVAGADGAVTVTNKFTESLLLPGDLMDMLVSFVPVPDSSIMYEYRVFSVPNTTSSPCGGSGQTGACVKSTACGVEAAMTPRSAWEAFRYDGTNVTMTATGLAQNVEQIFTVIGRPVGVNVTDRPDLAVAYTATTGTPEYFKESQLVSDDTIFVTLGIVAGVLVLLFVVAFVARRQLVAAFKQRAKQRRDEEVDTEGIRRQLLQRQQEQAARAAGRASAGEAGAGGAAEAGAGTADAGDAKPGGSARDTLGASQTAPANT